CEQFSECSMAGHNLIWVLQDIARIPVVVTGIGVLNQPQPTSPRFTGIEQLLHTPTPRMFLANRISYDMEHQLLFILEQLPVNMYSRNLMWFVQQCLSTPESETLFSDLIRAVDKQQPWLYTQYVDQYATGTLLAALVRDLSTMQEQFPGLFYTVLPQIYAAFADAFADAFAGCHGIVKSVLALIDQPQVYRLNTLILRGTLQLTGYQAASIAAIIGMVLDCNAFEQVCFWQLLTAALDASQIALVARYLLLSKQLDPLSNGEAATELCILPK
ncbi:hypothetical protein IWW42_005839, partial [Coemansia sp. RSA 1085]